MHHEATPHMNAIRVRYRCCFVFVDGLELARTNSNRMHLIKIKAFLEREQMTSKGQKVDCRIDVLCNLTIGGLASQMSTMKRWSISRRWMWKPGVKLDYKKLGSLQASEERRVSVGVGRYLTPRFPPERVWTHLLPPTSSPSSVGACSNGYKALLLHSF